MPPPDAVRRALPAYLVEDADEPSELTEHLDTIVRGEPTHTYELDSIDGAEEAMRRLVIAIEARDALAAQRDAWIEPIEQWYADGAEPIERQIEALTGLLDAWALYLRSEGRKSLALPSGHVATRSEASGPVIEWAAHDRATGEAIDGEALFVEWAAEHMDGITYEQCVRVKTSALISEVRKLVAVQPYQADGEEEASLVVTYRDEPVPGLTFREPKITPSVKPG